MPDDDDDDFYYYYSSDPPIDDDSDNNSSDEGANAPEQTDSELTPSRTITPASYSSPTKRGKSLPLRIVKGTVTIVGSALAVALIVGLISSRNKK